MPRFNVNVEFRLVTEIEPAYFTLGLEDAEGVSNYEDSSYWSRGEVRSNGGTVTFQVEAESDEAVYDLVHEFMREDMEIEDNDSVTWMVESVNVEVEEMQPELTIDSARGIVSEWLMQNPATIPTEVRDALIFLLARATFS